MKILGHLIVFILLISCLGCANNESDPPKMSVDHYVDLLKAGKYDHWELPLFTSKDIPDLLAYRDEAQLITDFPINGISSFWLPECALGMYVLWTIESIRARAINSEYLIGTFPSQNPVVEKKDDLKGIEQDNEVRATIADSYFDWWETNKNKDFNEFKQIDPLTNTEFRWH